MWHVNGLISTLLILGLCNGCTTARRAEQPVTLAKTLGFEGCKATGPLTVAQVLATDRSADDKSNFRDPDLDVLIRKYTPGDQIYLVVCTQGDASGILVGTSFYALAREGVVIARAVGEIYD